MSVLWNQEEDKILTENYGKISNIEIAKLLINRTVSSIANRALTLKITKKRYEGGEKYQVNENFFSIPNITNSYWAGYIAADASIYKNSDGLILQCNTKDEILIKNFKKDIESTSIIKYKDAKSFIKDEKEYKSGRQCYLYIGSYKIPADLNNIWNITPKKSLTLQPPNITDIKNIAAYIVGYTDGDGSTGIYNDIFYISWVGTYNILNWIQNNLKQMCPDLSWNSNVRKCGRYARLSYSCDKAKAIYSYLKRIEVPKLKRKWYYDFNISN